MAKELKDIRIKMKALGLTERQIDSIIKESLSGKKWSQINDAEKSAIIRSLNDRIAFARKYMQLLTCDSCCK